MGSRRVGARVSTPAFAVALAMLASACGGGGDASTAESTPAAAAEADKGWSQPAEFVDCKAASTEPKGCIGDKVPGTYTALPAADVTKKWNICVAFPHLKDDYWLGANYGVFEESKRLGVRMTLLDAGGYTNLSKQISQLDNCVAQGADAVVIGAISFDGLDAKVDEFVANGTPVVDIMNGISSPKVQAHALVNFYDMGFHAGKHLADLGKPVKVAWLPGPPGAGWVESANDGFQAAVKGSQVQVVATKYGDTGKDVQLSLVENVLQTYPDLNYIAGTAVTADAAAGALRERGLDGKVGLVADYMTPSTFELIKSGAVECAPTDQPVTQARMGIDMAVRLLEKKPLEQDLTRVGPQVQLVCGPGSKAKDNVADFVYETTFAAKGFKPAFSTE
jgi:protein TorT